MDESPDWRNEGLEQTRERLRRQWGDYPLTILVFNPINLRLARLLGPTGVTPNQLTVFSFVLMLVAAFCFATMSWPLQAAGGAVLLLAYLIDCLDGDLARYKGLKSPLGAMLDPMLDRFGEVAIALGAAIGGWRTTGDPHWLIGGIVLAGMCQVYFYLVDVMVKRLPGHQGERFKKPRLEMRGTGLRFGAVEPFLWGMAFLAVAGIPYWGVLLFGLMFSLGAVGQVVRIVRHITRVVPGDSERFGTHSNVEVEKDS